MTIEKTYIGAESLLTDSYRLAMMVLRSGFRPSFIVGVWRGGAPIGIAVQEVLSYHGVETDHIAIRTSSYTGLDQQSPEVKVFALGYLVEQLNPEDNLLIVDDVFDSGRSVEALLNELKLRCRHNMPNDIRVATAYYKPSRNRTAHKPDFFIHETADWLVFPHELKGLTREEIRTHKPGAEAILDD
jgi:hypoxanthine phosphoribosyltransferase